VVVVQDLAVRPREHEPLVAVAEPNRYRSAFDLNGEWAAETRSDSQGIRCGRRIDTWHTNGMNRARLSTTVDAELLNGARGLRSGATDAALIDEALRALLARHRSAEVDASYAAYDEHPVDEPDEWGDLASWRQAAATS